MAEKYWVHSWAKKSGSLDCRLIGSWWDNEGFSSSSQTPQLPQSAHCGFGLEVLAGILILSSTGGEGTNRWGSSIPGRTPSRRGVVQNHCVGSVGSPRAVVFLVAMTKSLTSHLRCGFWLSVAEQTVHCGVEGTVAREAHPWLVGGMVVGEVHPWLGECYNEVIHCLTGWGSRWSPTRQLEQGVQTQAHLPMPTRISPSFFLFTAYVCLFPQSPGYLRGLSILSQFLLIHLFFQLACKVHRFRKCLFLVYSYAPINTVSAIHKGMCVPLL